MKNRTKSVASRLAERFGLPACAVEVFEEQRRIRIGTLRQKMTLSGWIGTLVVIAGIVISTAHQQGLFGVSSWWGAIGLGLFVIGIISLGVSAYVGYWRDIIRADVPEKD